MSAAAAVTPVKSDLTMNTKTEPTNVIRIYLSGPIEQAKQVLREEGMTGLCVTIEPTLYIYTGGEEAGYVVGMLNYPRFPSQPEDLLARAVAIARVLVERTFQRSALVVSPEKTFWLTREID